MTTKAVTVTVMQTLMIRVMMVIMKVQQGCLNLQVHTETTNLLVPGDLEKIQKLRKKEEGLQWTIIMMPQLQHQSDGVVEGQQSMASKCCQFNARGKELNYIYPSLVMEQMERV